MQARPAPSGIGPFVVLILAVLAASGATARCLAYEPSRVTVKGEIEMRKLPGPPNYRSVARGDRPESVYFLKLEAPVCVSADPARPQRRGHASLEEIQLIVSAVDGSAAVGKKVRISGALSNAQGGQHRTPVVLTVKEMRPVVKLPGDP